MIYKNQRKHVHSSVWVPLIFLLMGVLLSGMLFFWMEEEHLVLLNSQFESDANNYIESIEREIQVSLDCLESTHSFFLASDFVSRKEFNKFTTPYIKKHESLQAIEWVPYVRHAERAGSTRPKRCVAVRV